MFSFFSMLIRLYPSGLACWQTALWTVIKRVPVKSSHCCHWPNHRPLPPHALMKVRHPLSKTWAIITRQHVIFVLPQWVIAHTVKERTVIQLHIKLDVLSGFDSSSSCKWPKVTVRRLLSNTPLSDALLQRKWSRTNTEKHVFSVLISGSSYERMVVCPQISSARNSLTAFCRARAATASWTVTRRTRTRMKLCLWRLETVCLTPEHYPAQVYISHFTDTASSATAATQKFRHTWPNLFFHGLFRSKGLLGFFSIQVK